MRSFLRVGAIATVAATALLTGCSNSGSESGSESAAQEGPVELTYWAWAPNIEKVVDLWNEENPDIKVTVSKQDGGDPAVTKLLTAINAGSGAPDLMQAEYQKIPTLVVSDALADISEGAGDLEEKFPEGIWSSVTLGGDALYAVPQDSGPMMFYYRSDIFEELGLEVPTTWEEYADAARAVHASDPNRYLETFSANDAGWFTGLSQQAGASWWSIDGDAWGVDIDSPETQKAVSFWGGLVEEGVVDNKPMYTPEWNAALNDGSQVGWLSAVWAPGVLSGNAADTAGLWKAAPMPTWEGEEAATGNWGGSSTAVTSQSEHVEAATEFATWLNTDPAAVQALADVANVYPAATEEAEAALTTAPEFFSNQPDFYDVAADVAQTVKPFTYGPNVNVTYSAYNDEFAKAAEAKTESAFMDALKAMQDVTVTDLEDNGFNVK
jgi:multiple sugar transport system substrate-binding protein